MQARTWLKELQRQPSAWTLADQALVQGTSIEVVFFAAQTIKNKVCRVTLLIVAIPPFITVNFDCSQNKDANWSYPAGRTA